MTTRRTTRARRNEQGFTLVEVVVSLMILAIGITGLSVVFPLAIQDAGKTGSVARAVQLCQQKLDDIQALSYDDPLLDASTAHADTLNPIDGIYRRSWVITEDSPIAGCKLVEVTVGWQARREEWVSLSSVIARAGR